MKDMYWDRVEEDVVVNFTLDASLLKLKSNEHLLIIPTVHDSDRERQMPGILLCGRRQYIMMQRRKEKALRKEGFELMDCKRFKRNDARIISYKSVLGGGGCERVTLSTYRGGCGDALLLLEEDTVESRVRPTPYEVVPEFLYVRPHVEAIKDRSERGQAFLDFPVNRTEILPNYRNNRNELAKIRKSMNLVADNPDVRISKIRIHGYASPEGPYANNARLARERSEALMEYIRDLYNFEDSLCEVKYTPEDWSGLADYFHTRHDTVSERLKQFMAASEEMLPDERERRLREMMGTDGYRHLVEEVFPSLRHSDYEISYVVRGFSPEEGVKYLKTRPGMLSLEEMFLIAQGYPEASNEFKEVFRIAVRVYPEDEVANLNAANIALEKRDFEDAEHFMTKAGESPEADYLRGMYHLLKDDFEASRKYLTQAGERGVAMATKALEQLDKREETIVKQPF